MHPADAAYQFMMKSRSERRKGPRSAADTLCCLCGKTAGNPVRQKCRRRWTTGITVRPDTAKKKNLTDYAVSTLSASCRPRALMDSSRILNFWILPEIVIGKSLTNITYRGIL